MKLFTVLGTGNYSECNYYLGEEKENNVIKANFVQTALVKYFKGKVPKQPPKIV